MPSADGIDWTSPEPPLRVTRPMLYQTWRDVVFLHWPVEAGLLAPHVPDQLVLETFESRAWISLISFRIDPMRPAGLPPVPGMRRAIETHLRTYVTAPDGQRGIWFLSLDIDPLQAALVGRMGFFLPYWWGTHRFEPRGDRLAYRVVRRLGPAARHVVEAVVGAPQAPSELGPLDHFLTARWTLFSRYGRVLVSVPVEHPRWDLRATQVTELRSTMLSTQGLPSPSEGPLAHVSPGLPARIAFPRPVHPGAVD